MSIDSERASGSWSISDNADKNNSPSHNMAVLDLTINNRTESGVPVLSLPFNPAWNLRNIRDDLIVRGNSDNNSVNSINHKFVAPDLTLSYKKTNEIVRILPEFNGRNISVNRFIRECKETKNFVNLDERNFFLKLVKSHVAGEASDYLQFKSFKNLEQLLSELKRVFSPRKNLPQAQTDLVRVKQDSNEKVSEYGLRVTKILQKAREIIDESFSPLVTRGMIEKTINTAIECFILGLDSEIATQMIVL